MELLEESYSAKELAESAKLYYEHLANLMYSGDDSITMSDLGAAEANYENLKSQAESENE